MKLRYASVSLADVAALDPARTLVVCVNNRYARRILSALSASLDASRQVIAVPAIMPAGAWLTQMADELSFKEGLLPPQYLVDDFGASLVWERAIQTEESEHALLDVGQAARLAREAARLIVDWDIDVRPEEETAEFQRFAMWQHRYRAYLDASDAEDSTLMYERVFAAVAQGLLPMSGQTLVLAGFNELTPRFGALLQAMVEGGLSVVELEQSTAEPQNIARITTVDAHAEWELAAQWAAEQLDTNARGCYAIVAPQLEASVPLVHRVLHRVLADRGHAYNIAVARSLADWPLVRGALAWLHLMSRYMQQRPCTAAALGHAVLTGGCAGHIEEAAARAALDAHWRHQAVIELSPTAFAQALDQRLPLLAAAWDRVLASLKEAPQRATLAFWAGHIRRFLRHLGFPGYSGLDSVAYQTLEALDDMLEKFARQDAVGGRVGFAAACSLLGRLARETRFQPQRDPDARLDVLGLLESEGGRWDGVWVLGLTDEVLPAVPRPNPLIPLSALRRAGAPRATPERELEWALTRYRSLLASAPAVWFSHAEQEGEEGRRPSPCIAALPSQFMSPPSCKVPACAMDYVVDDSGPAIDDGQPAKGGIALIEAQARNPLWAFVQFRLTAKTLPDYAVQADPSVRGRFLHRAMELLWANLPSQAELLAHMKNDGVHALSAPAVAIAADELLGDFSPIVRELECARAHGIIRRWLRIESERPPFTPAGLERDTAWRHGPLQLSVRLDRVDTLADGRLLIMDYKSGMSQPEPRKSWVRERPVDLQLPFYAAVLGQGGGGIAALVLARLHARYTDAHGISDGDCGLSGVVHYTDWKELGGARWEDVLARWRDAVHSLASEFTRGYAANVYVEPADLRFCDVLPFLRLNEEYPSDVQATE